MVPFSDKSFNNCGTAVISFDLASVAICDQHEALIAAPGGDHVKR
jgi:hypothetical protein